MTLAKELELAGLSSKEAIVYIALLKNSPIGGGKLAKILSMDRTHTYNLLTKLVDKGLAGHITIERKTLFQATSPKNLLNEVKKKERTLKAILPELINLEKVKTIPAKVSILEGKAGLRTLVRMLYKPKDKELLVFGATGKSYEVLKYEMPHAVKKISLTKMKARIITNEKLRGHPFTKVKSINVRYVEEATPSSTFIFGNIVSINVFDEKPFIILIESKSVADSYKKYFEHLWKTAKK